MKTLPFVVFLCGFAACCFAQPVSPETPGNEILDPSPWVLNNPDDLSALTVSMATEAPEFEGGEAAASEEPLLEVSAALAGFGAGYSGPIIAGNEADYITPEILAHARGLGYDPLKIYAYCRYKIKYEHYFGSKRGAALTLSEGRGNSFDISALMVSLLRASGYNASYRYGPRIHPDYYYSGWLGLWPGFGTRPYNHLSDTEFRQQYGYVGDSRSTSVLRKVDLYTKYSLSRGFPAVQHAGSTAATWVLPHVWVLLEANNTTYEWDPSYRTIGSDVSVNDWKTSLGYDRATLLADIGGTSGASHVSGINEGTLNSRLTTFSTNLSNWIRGSATARNATVDNFLSVIKFNEFSYENYGSISTLTPGTDYATTAPWLPVSTWTAIPATWMGTLTIQCGTGTYNTVTKTFPTQYYSTTLTLPSLRARKLALSFSGNTGSFYQDDDLLGNLTIPASSFSMRLAVNQPFGSYDLTNGAFTPSAYADAEEIKTYKKANANAYVLLCSFSANGKLLRQRQEILERYKRQGLGENTRQIKTELLNILGLNWMAQTQLNHDAIASMDRILRVSHHRIGRMCQEAGYFIDVGIQNYGHFAFDANNPAKLTTAFQFEALLDSALEHSIVEQMQGPGSDGISTIKVLQLANSLGHKTYRANSANWSGTSGVRSALEAKGYSAITLDSMALAIAAGGNVLVPEVPNLGLGQWTGTGYAAASSNAVTMAISGGYSGGYASLFGTPDFNYITAGSVSSPSFYYTYGSNLDFQYDPLLVPDVYGADPVDLLTGAFTYEQKDLVVGAGTLPKGLAFSRVYSSSRTNDLSSGLGHGWTHSLDVRITERSSPFVGLGGATPYQMVPYLTSLIVARDLYANATTAKDWQAACMAVNWAADQLHYKAVVVSFGHQSMEFVLMPDGTYAPPPGANLALSKVAGNYVVSERHGNTYAFNGDKRLGTVTSQHGKVATFTYSSGKLTQVKDCFNRTITLTWSGEKITGVADSTGRAVGFGYTADALSTVTDAAGSSWTFLYDSEQRMQSLRDPLNRVIVTNTYDGQGRVIEQQNQGDAAKTWKLYYSGFETNEEDPEGGVTTYVFDDKGRSIRTKDRLGYTTTMAYDGQDHLVSSKNKNNYETKFEYDGNNNLTNTRDPMSANATGTYDSSQRLTVATDFLGNPTTLTYNTHHQVLTVKDAKSVVIATNGYDASGNLTSITDSAGNATSYTYDTYENVSRVDYPGGGFSAYLYNPRGDLTQSTDGRGQVTTYSYNARRQPLVTTFPGGATVVNTYDLNGDLVKVKDANGNESLLAYTATGKVLSTTLPTTSAGASTLTNTYDDREWLVGATDSLGRSTSYVHDAEGRILNSTDPLGRIKQYTYSAIGHTITAKNALNHTTIQARDNRGNPTTGFDPLGYSVFTTFDAEGNLRSLRNRRSKTFTNTFDVNNRPLTTATPLGRTTTRAWNDRGLLASVTQPSGEVTSLTYDARGRIQTEVNPLRTQTYAYDHNNNPLSITSGTSVISRTYDNRDRVASYTDADGNSTSYLYDGNGNLTQLTYPGGKQVTYAYDALNHLTAITDWNVRTTSYTYDIAGRLTQINRPNGTTRTITYDLADQVTKIEERKSDGSRFLYYGNGYDLAGRLTSEFSAPVAVHKIPPVNSIAYDDDNQISTFNGLALAYDLDGNLTSGPLFGATPQPFVYDALNRLTSAGGHTYEYDLSGNRIGVTSPAGVTRYVLDSGGRALIKIAPGGAKTYYVYGIGLAYQVDEAEQTRSYHADLRGSTAALTADDGLTVTDRFDYAPWGKSTRRLGVTDTPFLYNGAYGVMTDANGLVYMRARYYHPQLMRFLNPDPSGFAGGLNLFAYASGNPISRLDPLGLADRSVVGSSSIFAGAWGAAVDSGGRYSGAVVETFKFWKWPQNVADFAGGHLASAIFMPGEYFDLTSETNVQYFKHQFGTSEGWGSIGGSFLLASAGASASANIGTGSGFTRVTSWADDGVTPEIAAGRWVQVGEATPANYFKTGLPGPKVYRDSAFPYFRIEGSRASFDNSITQAVPTSSLVWPPGLEAWKGILGQRKIKTE